MAGPVRNPVLRGVLLSLGFLWLGIGFVGIALPGIPTTAPVLLAAFFFSKSSQRFDDWLVNNRLFGGVVRDWRAGRGFTVGAKVVAVAAIALTFFITITFATDSSALRIALVLLAVAIATFVVTRPTKRAVQERSPESV